MFNQEDFEFHRQECYHEEKLNYKIDICAFDEDDLEISRPPINKETILGLLCKTDSAQCLVTHGVRDAAFMDEEAHYWACLADYALQELFKRAYNLESTENVRNTEN